MNSKQIIEAAGGRQAVIALTGLSRGRISQWCTENYIPSSWLQFLKEKFPAIGAAKLDLSETYRRKS